MKEILVTAITGVGIVIVSYAVGMLSTVAAFYHNDWRWRNK